MPDPAASAGQVVVDVEVASVNYPDVLLVAGGYQALPPLPFVVGGEFAGTISEVGAGVTGFAVGDRVFGVSGFGAFAERIAVDAQALRRIPDGLDATSAAAFSVTYETAYHSLAQRRPGATRGNGCGPRRRWWRRIGRRRDRGQPRRAGHRGGRAPPSGWSSAPRLVPMRSSTTSGKT